MSVSRTSGAIPQITARQMATASFAVPKSVMKTIVGRAVEVGGVAGAVGFAAGCEHPQIPTTKKSDNATSKRTRTLISGVNDVVTIEIAGPGELEIIHEHRNAAIFARKILAVKRRFRWTTSKN